MTRVRIPQPDTEEDVSAERLIESAVAAGRYVHVTTYHDGATPIRASLLFKTAADAVTCARVLSKATVGSAVLADIVGPARAASVGAYCEPWLFVAELRVRLSCKLPACDRMGCSAARGAGESEE
jgi:hypothetical protein